MYFNLVFALYKVELVLPISVIDSLGDDIVFFYGMKKKKKICIFVKMYRKFLLEGVSKTVGNGKRTMLTVTLFMTLHCFVIKRGL